MPATIDNTMIFCLPDFIIPDWGVLLLDAVPLLEMSLFTCYL